MFSQLSIELTKSLNQKTKKDNGIYFTPESIIKKIYNYICSLDETIKIKLLSICEPSCGSLEFVNFMDQNYFHDYYNEIEIDAFELNTKIYDNIKNIKFMNRVKIENIDYLSTSISKKYDLIIGNPPYYVMKKNNVPKEYIKYCNGRPNIFGLFIIHSINKLKPDGLLAFVLPKSFLNCNYYSIIREFIYNTLTILTIIDCINDKYIETGQETIILIIQNKVSKTNNNYVIKNDNFIIFNTRENIIKLNKIFENSTNLDKFGFKVNVGKITWNECKDILTDDKNNTLLIYSGDIKNNQLKIKEYKDVKKKNYINKQGINGPILVVNRGYDKGNYSFNYCLINIENDYLIENHLICIIPKKEISKKELLSKYNKIVESFKDERTSNFVKIYFGNNAINTNELQYILPIYN